MVLILVLVVHALACVLRLQRLLWMRVHVRVRVVHALAGMLRHQRLRGRLRLRMKLVLVLLRMRGILRMSRIL